MADAEYAFKEREYAPILDRSSDTVPYRRMVENFIGTVEVPVGLAGPLKIEGGFAAGEYHVPLATTEAALVASYSRGASTMTEAGGCHLHGRLRASRAHR